MKRRIFSFAIAVIMLLAAMPVASSAADNDSLALILSADEAIADTIDVNLYVKSDNLITPKGAYAYFTFDSSKLNLIDSEGNAININSMASGSTFIANGINAVSCIDGWSDDSSFAKKSGSAVLVGLEIAPGSNADVKNGVNAGFIRLKIANGDFGDFEESWISPVREKTDNLAFVNALFETTGKSEPVINYDSDDDVIQLSCEHQWAGPYAQAPANGKNGEIHYICTVCGLLTGVQQDGSPIEKASSTQDGNPLIVENESVLAAAEMNSLVTKTSGGDVYIDYTARGASLRMKNTEDDGKSDMRFTASVHIPDGAEIIDFGMVYTPAERLLKEGAEGGADASSYNVEKLVTAGVDGNLGVNSYGIQVAILSYKNTIEAGKTFNFTTYEEGVGVTGASIRNDDRLETADYVSYNLVISNIKLANYTRFYAVRSYCVYKYLGQTITIYDSVVADDMATCSARSVLYVAEKIYAADTSSEHEKQYVYDRIISKV